MQEPWSGPSTTSAPRPGAHLRGPAWPAHRAALGRGGIVAPVGTLTRGANFTDVRDRSARLSPAGRARREPGSLYNVCSGPRRRHRRHPPTGCCPWPTPRSPSRPTRPWCVPSTSRLPARRPGRLERADGVKPTIAARRHDCRRPRLLARRARTLTGQLPPVCAAPMVELGRARVLGAGRETKAPPRTGDPSSRQARGGGPARFLVTWRLPSWRPWSGWPCGPGLDVGHGVTRVRAPGCGGRAPGLRALGGELACGGGAAGPPTGFMVVSRRTKASSMRLSTSWASLMIRGVVAGDLRTELGHALVDVAGREARASSWPETGEPLGAEHAEADEHVAASLARVVACW